ncbi:hypothetical protein B0T11DRAFT_357537 [Plectosphaerella cucumerina]|uniref:chitinase n=1 Tax=Plectosphaerella cucumerina TaxID=40658 RepID=A0A8K0T6R0_9PEZI|nr:hypothetical protein B0T11DRAFT_357537 [Plectosphaerella cucumerina]
MRSAFALSTFSLYLLLVQFFFVSSVQHGFCGTTSDHCGTGCLSTCNWKPTPAPATECSKTKLCATGCCSQHGFCGTTSAHCGTGCLSTCDWKAPATECSKTKLCATGCCSKHGFCGTSEDHCGTGCLSTCDFKLGCDAKNPCKKGTGCCSKFGFCGFGPDFCSKASCVAGCDAKTYCDPGGYGSQYAEITKCPLNVCCSKFGYCGLTKEFCGNKPVPRPQCSISSTPMRRVVGYYEGWATGRACNQFTPETIPNGVYTHLNYAFASIDPKTFRIVPAASADPDLFRRLVRKKEIDPNLKVFIAIGGWAFNDPGPTVTTFSDIARSEANQRTFISSLVSFMNTYGFDGVDIDWEYPGAPDRKGRGEDFQNLPKFLRNIKGALGQNGARNGLSIAIPASYWYLQHFDIKKIAESVDFFNVMTYDQHGTWDTPTSWLGNHLNSHTNLTEIKEAMDLLWRNNIKPDQVNLGLAYYSRTFTASNANCMTKGCLFDSGSPKGRCSNAVGVLSNAEIVDMMKRPGAKVTLDREAAVKILTVGREWITYDDAESWKIKVDYARSQCLGGVMVWAISQDTMTGTFAKQLQSVTKYKSSGVSTWQTGIFKEPQVEAASAATEMRSCQWTKCGTTNTCATGWTATTRGDRFRNSATEKMIDHTACLGGTWRVLCCPSSYMPESCGWYNHNNGKCDPTCPANSYEIASTSFACNNGKSQVACCSRNSFSSVSEVFSMRIWGHCKWYGTENQCARNQPRTSCTWDSSRPMTLLESWDGSGGQVCRDDRGRGPRPYCCPSQGDNTRWENCAWYDGFSDSPLVGMWGDKQCASGCPNGKVKVTLDRTTSSCSKGGAAAYCCDAIVTSPRVPILSGVPEDLAKWVQNPTCPAKDKKELQSRDLGSHEGLEKGLVVARQQQPQPSGALASTTLKSILGSGSGASEAARAWDATIPSRWTWLTADMMKSILWPARTLDSETVDKVVEMVLCDMQSANELAKEFRLVLDHLHCPLPTLDTINPSLLVNPDDTKLESYTTSPVLPDPDESFWQSFWNPVFGARAGETRDATFKCTDTKDTVKFVSQTYINGKQGENLRKANKDNRRYYVDNLGGSCGDVSVKDDGKMVQGKDEWVSEHILELQAFRDFALFTNLGMLAPKTVPVFNPYAIPLSRFEMTVEGGPIPCEVWSKSFIHGFPAWNAEYKDTPMKAIYDVLGSETNSDHMVNCESKLNGMKTQVWKLNRPVANGKWNKCCSKATKAHAEASFMHFQLVLGVWMYLKNPEIHSKLIATHVEIVDTLEDFALLYAKGKPGAPYDLGGMWREFMTAHFERMEDRSAGWMGLRLATMKTLWNNRVAALWIQAAGGIDVLSDLLIALEVLAELRLYETLYKTVISFDADIFMEAEMD